MSGPVRPPSRPSAAASAASAYRALRRVIPHERWAEIRRRVHPALRYTLRRRLSGRAPSIGRISVVVPCYQVERYLASCLNSIIAQSYTDLEIIVVIDGSPDDSARIARRYARWDRRIRVIDQANAGLGAARNTGIRAATGDFIAFVDSDDSLPLDAYTTMTEALARSGSDFVVGNLVRTRGTTSWVPAWAQDVHRHDRLGITLEDFPEVLADVFSWNKLFRRPFFMAAVGGFPEGIRYEDQEPTAKAYALARSFDVLSETTYRWAIRGDGSSITQQKSQLSDLHDRLTVMRHVSDVLAEHCSATVLDEWQAKSVGLDLRAYYNEVPRTGTDYWSVLRDGVRYITKQMRPTAWDLVAVHDRLLARMTEADARDDLCIALVDRNEHGDGMTVDLAADPPLARPLYLRLVAFRPQDRDLILSPQENRLDCVMTGYQADETHIVVEGLALIPGAAVPIEESGLTGRLVRRSDRAPLADVPVDVDRFVSPVLDEIAGDAATSHAEAGFRASIDVTALAAALDGLTTTDGSGKKGPEVYLELALRVHGRVWRRHVTRRDRRGTANRLEPGPLHGDRRIAARFSDDVGLLFRLATAQVVAEQASVQGRVLTLTLRATDGTPIEQVRATCRALGMTISARVSLPAPRVTVSITIPALPPGAPPLRLFAWRLTADQGRYARTIAAASAARDFEAAQSRAGLRPTVAAGGRIELVDRKTDAVVVKAETDETASTICVEGNATLAAGTPFAVAFASGSTLWYPRETSWDPTSGRFRAVFDVARESFGQPGIAHASGGYSFRLLTDPQRASRSLWPPVHRATIPELNSGYLDWHLGEHAAVRFTVTSTARALWLSVRSAIDPRDTTRLGRYRLEQGIPAIRRSGLRDAVLFSCFGGQAAGDSPLAIHDELRRRGFPGRLIWAAADGAAALPEGVDRVLVGSADYLDVLHTSRWLVNNNNFPYYFRKRPDQFYLQTWHGTPLKRIGNDVPSASLSLSYRSLMERETRAWDVLLAQNEFAAATLPRAFGYDGSVLTVGYPRNDGLARTTAERQQVIRERLGIAGSGRVFLYAPTWRDNRRTSSNGYAAVTYLDVAAASRWLGTKGMLLLRGHSNTPGFNGAGRYPNVMDVSAYPDIADLLEIADALVTDYSSVMFDFAVTGRPMIFLTPDLDEYRSSTRGFYLDFESIAPGPMLGSSDEVLAALDGIASGAERYRERYVRFQERFTPLDDGKAAQRVVDAVWSPKR